MDHGIILTIDDTPSNADVFAIGPSPTASITSHRGAPCARHRVEYNWPPCSIGR
jgi:hypothetical protein